MLNGCITDLKIWVVWQSKLIISYSISLFKNIKMSSFADYAMNSAGNNWFQSIHSLWQLLSLVTLIKFRSIFVPAFHPSRFRSVSRQAFSWWVSSTWHSGWWCRNLMLSWWVWRWRSLAWEPHGRCFNCKKHLAWHRLYSIIWNRFLNWCHKI